MTGDGDDESSPSGAQSPGPACVPCRTKKHKCSRGDPCETCVAAGSRCYYVERQKRGVKPGHFESLNRRMEQLESLVLGQSLMIAKNRESNEQALAAALDKMRQELLNEVKGPNQRKRPVIRRESASVTDSPQSARLSIDHEIDHRSFKRIKETPRTEDTLLPSEEIMLELCDHYFRQIHPWIPILHEEDFMQEFKERSPKILPVLQAICAVTVKYTNLAHSRQDSYYHQCREAVLLRSMDRFSVETLQASVIIAFDTIGSGRGPRSWSIVSSATRVVEQLGLSTEEDTVTKQRLLGRVGLLRPAKTVTEREVRRRIFWAIFQMDRFCSVTTGWNTCITGSDVRLRLPTEGYLFRDQVDRKTRYFNISDPEVDPTDDNNALGGYAYLIEATECLSRVSNFLRQERVDPAHRSWLKVWFTNFQALDSMLVRWKNFLPPKWQYASATFHGKMDENLTLAHVTHNTSIILLHQNVAFPPPGLNFGLPSQNSIQTCIVAANEITTITSNFLVHVKISPSPQFALCIFVAARILLTHSVAEGTVLNPNFNTLVDSLWEISKRWAAGGPTKANLASKFATRLLDAQNSRSAIDSRAAVFNSDDDEDNEAFLSLASPPIVEMFQDYRDVQAPDTAIFDFDIENAFTDLDHIFMWHDNVAAATGNSAE
ncbi:hypothetical protein TRVA0_007S01442 [Trichomonascus vanleenenianus]|uniref:uncharacterized protein n=1 Tax=Trichomonascus vanleenenianus TaxID=2268995 RepID=UPI003EC9907C